MNITLAKVKRVLEKDYGWSNMNIESQKFLIDELIKDTLKIIDNELRTHKGISIKKR
jgi:hypothetical protein